MKHTQLIFCLHAAMLPFAEAVEVGHPNLRLALSLSWPLLSESGDTPFLRMRLFAYFLGEGQPQFCVALEIVHQLVYI
jgi:hypothetical protein